MKKIAKLFFIACGLLLIAASCEKEGVYNPKQKISKVYWSQKINWQNGDYEDIEKHLSEVWNWEGNQLRSIQYYDEDGDWYGTEEYYYYANDRIYSINWQEPGELISNLEYKFEYDGKKLSVINYYYDNDLIVQYEVSHQNGKISQIKYTYMDYNKKAIAMSPTFFRIFLPEMDAKTAKKLANKLNERKSETSIIRFKWSGKNISQVIWGEEADAPFNEFTYDKKINPFKKFFDTDAVDELDFPVLNSQNNVVKCSTNYGSDVEELEYIYTYDGDYPIAKSYTERNSSVTTTYNEYYEYQ